ncbi:FxLYD domain-containing protein [Bifidobacterium callitrichidarum]|uniref:Uncharacterized protein n=1 Tax=Bifidobacterium callitrichidarum TaxID=2052941 RepID=A0A2U2NBM3_9BIFI|nr:FxLYD domain-containing protein [Bifidobacterium callitrichidarum]PWG66434.1 hypothetical protein DF196_03370 [Bifidobacterium callitrichidarum]
MSSQQPQNIPPRMPAKPTPKTNPMTQNVSLPLWVVLVIAAAALIVGLVGGLGGMFLYATPVISKAKTDYANEVTYSQKLEKQVQDSQASIDSLTQENANLSQQLEELQPTANDGTTGLTIMERNVVNSGSTILIEYVVRNDTNKTADEISMDFRFLDAQGNTVSSGAWTNNASVEPGKTGIVTAYGGFQRDDHASIVGVQAEKAYITINGEKYSVDLPDNEPVVNF